MRPWGAIALILLTAGCARPVQTSNGSDVAPALSRSASAMPHWTSVDTGCPTLGGPDRALVTDGPEGVVNGRADETTYIRGCTYGSVKRRSYVHVSVDIDRTAAPGKDRRADMEFGDRVARQAGHMVVPLTGVGDRGLVIVDRKAAAADQVIVLAEIMSGNALISANILLDGPIHNEQDLRAHTDEIVTVMSDALEDLRP